MRNNEDRLGTNLPRQDLGFPPQVLQQPAAQTQPIGFVMPTEFVQLPSRGKFYPVGHPLHGKDSIEIKQMTAKEEDILTAKSLIKKGVVLDRLIESLLIDKSVRVDDLLIADKNAIVVTARISGYGSDYETQVICPACEAKSKHSFDLLEHVEGEEESETNQSVELSEHGTFSIKLPRTGWSVELKPLTSRDEKVILKGMQETKKPEQENALTQQLGLLIASINGETSRDMLNQAISVMPSLDTKFLRKEYAKVMPSMNLRKTFVCGKCSHEEIMEVPITADFFWPK